MAVTSSGLTVLSYGSPLTGHTGGVRSVATVPLPDGRVLLASGSIDQKVRLWDPVSKTPVGAPLTGHTHIVWSVAAVPLPDGRVLLASGSIDQTVRLWEIARRTHAARPARPSR